MKKQTQAIHVPYKRRDAYDALSMPVYNAVAYEFDNAQTMSDAFCNRIDAPDYSRCENPTVSNFEERVKALTGAKNVIALNSGMAAKQYHDGAHSTGKERGDVEASLRQHFLFAHVYAS